MSAQPQMPRSPKELSQETKTGKESWTLTHKITVVGSIVVPLMILFVGAFLNWRIQRNLAIVHLSDSVKTEPSKQNPLQESSTGNSGSKEKKVNIRAPEKEKTAREETNAPNGIAIGGRATVVNPTVNNFAASPKLLSAEDAFAVAVETRIFVIPGEGRGISFWAWGRAPNGCSLQSVQAALFMRITNLQPEHVLITAYTVEAMGVPLTRIKMNLYKPFVILARGALKPSDQFGPPIQMPVPDGGVGSWVNFPVKDADPTLARPVQADYLDM